MAGLSAGARNLQNRLGSALINQMKNIENLNWAKRQRFDKPMDWSYRQLNAIRNDVSGQVSVSEIREIFSGFRFLQFLPQSGSVPWGTVVSALRKRVDWELANYTVKQLNAIAEAGNINQLGKWQSAISERGIGDFRANKDWLASGQALDGFIEFGNKTIADVFAEAQSEARSVVSAKWNHLIATANNIQNIIDLYNPFPAVGSSTDLRTVLGNGLSNLDRVLGDGQVLANQLPSGLFDYFRMLQSDVAWLKARKSTTAPPDVNAINGPENFSSLDAVNAAVQSSLVGFIERQTTWMTESLQHYKQVKSNEQKERAILIATAVFAAVAMVGSLGFAVSNRTAVLAQWKDAKWNSANLPALFGSATLFANNTVCMVTNSIRADGKKIDSAADIRTPMNAALLDAMGRFDAANIALKDQIFTDAFKDMYYHSGRWDGKYADVLYSKFCSQGAAQDYHFATQAEVDQYVSRDQQKNYIAFFWGETSFTPQRVGGLWTRGIVGIKKAEYSEMLADAGKTFKPHSLDLPYLATGGAGDDYLSNPTIGIDGTIDGGAGDDVLEANDANNTLIGGDGDDYLLGGLGDNSLSGGSGSDELQGGDGNETLEGGDDDDTLLGGEGDDYIWAVSGNDNVDGGAGNDSVIGFGTGNLVAFGGDGDDYFDLSPNNGNSTVSGDAGNDYILASHYNSCALSGGDGNDTLYGENGSDTITGDAGDDVIYGNGRNSYFKDPGDAIVNDNNWLDGGAGNDQLFSASGNDTLLGGAGNDAIQGRGGGNLSASGGDGDDYIDLWANTGRSSASGDAGNDNLVASRTAASSLSGGDGNDTLYGENGADTLTGGAGNDVIYGNGEYTKRVTGNIVNNGRDSNRLDGGAGDDKIYGSAGSDVIIGGSGSNTLTGDAGADTFVFRPSDGGSNYIWDFNEAEGDSILIASGQTVAWSWTSQTQNIGGTSVAFWKLNGSTYALSGASTGAFDNIFIRKDGYVNSNGMINPNVRPTTWLDAGSNY